jgi:hypothetical protein
LKGDAVGTAGGEEGSAWSGWGSGRGVENVEGGIEEVEDRDAVDGSDDSEALG